VEVQGSNLDPETGYFVWGGLLQYHQANIDTHFKLYYDLFLPHPF
jgi:hypothetical protein